jgi:glyoxylase-like metal-dependent hydrolase (beta-lactamase superfamily II)
MKRDILLGAIGILGALSIAVAASQAPAPQGPKSIDIVKLKDNLYVLTSSTPGDRATFSGGNVAVFITDDGVTLVDTKLAGWGQAMLDKIKTVTTKPVTTIINTHTHGDHTGNNEMFGTAVSIVQENTKANMARMDAFKGDKAQFLPKRTFTDTMTVGSGQNRIELHYFGPGHTNGDAFVVFPTLRVVHAGDMFAWKDAPFCDRMNGGSCVAFPQTLSKALAGIKNVDTVIGGHLPTQAWKDLQEYQRYNADLVAAATAAQKAGKTADEAAASIDLTPKYPGYKSERVKAAVAAMYDELKSKTTR